MKLLLSILILFLFLGCSDQSKKDTKQVVTTKKKVEVEKEILQPKKVVKKEESKKAEVKQVVAKTKEKVKKIAKTISSTTDNKEVKKVAQKITKALDGISVSQSETAKNTNTAQNNDLQSAAAGLMSGFGGSATQSKKSSVDGAALFITPPSN